MEERATIPVSLPRSHPTISYWQDPADEIADLRSTASLPDAADAVIIGSGITGAAIAWNLLEKSADGQRSIVMLEARQACSGATGRNGGHTKAASYRSFLSHQERLGTPAAVQIAQLELTNIREVHMFAADHSIPCDSTACDTVDIVYEPERWEQDKAAVEAMRAAMSPTDPAAVYQLHSKEEVRDKFLCGSGGDETVCGGISYEAGSLSAYKFGIGVLKLCLQKGLNLQTHTPALDLRKVGDIWEVDTTRGIIKAKTVVLATNGYTAKLLKPLQGVIVPTRGHVTAQRPGRAMPQHGLETTYSFIYKGGFEYMIPRPKGSRFEGDIVIGGGLAKAPKEGLMEYGTTDDTECDEGIIETLHDCLPQYFGDNWGADHPDGRIRKAWTGIMGYSSDGFPLVGEVPGDNGLWMSCSFQGHGMVLCWMCAKALVAMMEGQDNQQLKSWFPDCFRVTEERMMNKFKGIPH